jgi:outer membrane protein assembly factor BamB
VLWSVEVCEGYAGPAVVGDRVYLNDYDRTNNAWLVRCFALADGRELWRYTDPKRIRPNHGITRTVPAVDSTSVFALDPKCVFHCLDAATGQERWSKNFVRDYNAQIPPWYNGQCPLLEDDRVILGVGGDALIVALDQRTGREIWRTPNEKQWPLAHASIMPAELCGEKQYLWCTLFGPLGVRASDGRLLWHHPRQFNVAVAPSPLPVPPDRVFMTSGYDAGSVMLRLIREGDTYKTEALFDVGGEVWNAEVHTPILLDGHLFAVGKKRRGLFTCLDLDGKTVWDSADHAAFDLGSFLLADGLFFVLEGKTGMLRLLEANTTAYRELAHAPVLSGHDVWGPMALSGGKLLLRDMTKLVCIEVGAPQTAQAEPIP